LREYLVQKSPVHSLCGSAGVGTSSIEEKGGHDTLLEILRCVLEGRCHQGRLSRSRLAFEPKESALGASETSPPILVLFSVEQPSASLILTCADAGKTRAHVLEGESFKDINLLPIFDLASCGLLLGVHNLCRDVYVVSEMHAAALSSVHVAIIMSTAMISRARVVFG
jgi:hypothetical protein